MSEPMKFSDPAYWLLENPNIYSTPVPGLYRENCYICCDPEFAQMGMPLCYACFECGGHVPADDVECENGHDNEPDYEALDS